MSAPNRPALRYHGGKWKLAPWIISFFPGHRQYVEPYGGTASVLLRKPRAHGEVYNDLDQDVVNVFRVLRDPATARELRRRLELTPFSRVEFKAAYDAGVDNVDRAFKMIVRSFMGFGSASMTRTHVTGFRKNANRNGTTPAQDWMRWPAEIPAFVERLQGVVIENKAATEVMVDHDLPDTLHFVDPPYVHATRSSIAGRKRHGVKHAYRCEMSDEDHAEMAACLNNLRGMVIISGYPSSLYDSELFPGWERFERRVMADGARPRTEVIWLNAACSEALARQQVSQQAEPRLLA